jgi:hypothetical protein
MASADMDIIVAVAALISRSIYRLVAFDAILRLRLLSSFCKLLKSTSIMHYTVPL